MLKLMRLELQKNNNKDFLTHTITTIIMTIVFLGLIMMIFNMESMLTYMAQFGTANGADILEAQLESIDLNKMTVINSLLGLGFIIYGSVNYARYVVNGIRTNELQNLFLYPISRVKIVYAKITLGFVITTISFFISKTLILLCLSFLQQGIDFSVLMLAQNLIDGMTVAIIAMVGMLVGIMRKSTIATIVSGLIASTVLYGNIGQITLAAEIPWMFYTVAVIIFAATIYYIQKVIKKDFLN